MSNVIFLLYAGRPGLIEPDPITGMGGGSGTEEDPFLIATPTQLNNLRNYPTAHFKQVRHLNLDPVVLAEEPWYDPATGWVPFGPTWGEPFNGHYSGNGYTIQNMHINRPGVAHQGFFTGLGPQANVKNIQLLNASVVGGQKAGILAGYSDNAVIDGVVLSGTVEGSWRTGGVIGETTGASGLISNIFFTGSVVGTGWLTGGAVGYNTATWQQCTVQADVEVNGGGGGFCGENLGSLNRCSKYGTLVSSGGNLGGFAYANSGTIYQCRMVGPIQAGSGNFGGLCNTNSGIIRETYAISLISGAGWNIGGLVNSNTGLIVDCYGLVSITNTTAGYALMIVSNKGTAQNIFVAGTRTGGNMNQSTGGISKFNAGINCYYDSDLAQDTSAQRSTPKTTLELKQGMLDSNDIYTGWDPLIWDTIDSATYPKLKWELEEV